MPELNSVVDEKQGSHLIVLSIVDGPDFAVLREFDSAVRSAQTDPLIFVQIRNMEDISGPNDWPAYWYQ